MAFQRFSLGTAEWMGVLHMRDVWDVGIRLRIVEKCEMVSGSLV